jgi:DNA polymerase-3 subunit delta
VNPAPPRVYLFFGEDEFGMAEAVAGMRQRLGDPGAADLNSITLQGGTLDFDGLAAVSRSLPFLSTRRLIVVQQAEELARRTDALAHLDQLLASAPPSTALVLLDRFDLAEAARHARKTRTPTPSPEDLYLGGSSLGRWAKRHRADIHLRAFPKMRGAEFLQWIRQRAGLLGASIDEAAAGALAEAVQDDPRLAENELRKLIDFSGGERPIRMNDVVRLTPYRGQADVFDMVDAIGRREGRLAMGLLHRLLEEEDSHYVFAMVIRQFRLLILAAESPTAAETPAALARLPRFVLSKLLAQARNFSPDELPEIYRRLLEVDLAEKTGQADLVSALEALVAECVG